MTDVTARDRSAAATRRDDFEHHLHPFTDFATFAADELQVIASGEGAYVTDSDGRRYLDGLGGLWCVNIGHGRREMAEAIARQAQRLEYYNTFVSQTTAPPAELAAKLASLAPRTLNHVFFGTSGSDANDTAVRMIHFYFNRLGLRNKKKIITRHDGYHGTSFMAMSLTGIAYDHIGFDLVPGDLVHRVSTPNVYRRPAGMSEPEWLDALANELTAKIEALGAENVAAFFAEPIMGAGGVLVAPKGYHRRMREICARFDVLYVSDEVVTAFGRLGHFFASEEYFDIVPDIITCAKGITSGYLPLSATLISDSIHEVLRVPQAPGAMFTHGYTYSGHPVCCAAALANIEIMEREDICGHVRDVGPYFKKRLEGLLDLPIVGDVRGSHFMLCVESVGNRDTKEPFAPEVAVGRRIAAAAQRRGVLVRPIGHLTILSPPLILTRGEIDQLVDVLHASVQEVVDQLTREGHRLV